MTSRPKWTLGIAAVGLALAVPGVAEAATKTVYMGAAPPQATRAQMQVFDRNAAEAMDFYPRTVRVRRGDSVSFEARGFHTVDLPGTGRTRPLPLISPTDQQAGTLLDAAGVPFWFSNSVPVVSFNPRLLAQGFGKVKRQGSQSVLSGLPLSDRVRPMRVRFPRSGSFRYFCNIHPGMVGTVRVVAANRRVPSAAADTRVAKRQIATAVAAARRVTSTSGIPANTMNVGAQRGTVHHFGFVPSKLTVARGTTVTFRAVSNARDAHTATFGPGDPNKDPKKEPNNYMAKLASTFQGPGPFDPIATYPSEPPTAPTAALSPTLHGNGFWNSGVIGPPVTGLPRNGRVTFNTPGAYKVYCLIHPFMTGTITVQ